MNASEVKSSSWFKMVLCIIGGNYDLGKMFSPKGIFDSLKFSIYGFRVYINQNGIGSNEVYIVYTYGRFNRFKIDILVLFQNFYYQVSGYLCPGQDDLFRECFDSLKLVKQELIFGLYYSEYFLDKMIIPKGKIRHMCMVFGFILFRVLWALIK